VAVKVGLAYAPDGSHLVQSGQGGEIIAVDARTGDVRQRWAGHALLPLGAGGSGALVYSLAFRKDGTLATCGSDATIRLWKRDGAGEYRLYAVWSTLRLSSYRAMPGFRKERGPGDPPGPDLVRSFGEIQHALFTPDGEYLVAWGRYVPVHVIHVETALREAKRLSGEEVVRETERVVGLRLNEANLVPIDRNRLVAPKQ